MYFPRRPVPNAINPPTGIGAIGVTAIPVMAGKSGVAVGVGVAETSEFSEESVDDSNEGLGVSIASAGFPRTLVTVMRFPQLAKVKSNRIKARFFMLLSYGRGERSCSDAFSKISESVKLGQCKETIKEFPRRMPSDKTRRSIFPPLRLLPNFSPSWNQAEDREKRSNRQPASYHLSS